MAVTPALPPYAHLNQEAVQCIAQASERYEVPELLIHSILMKENGRTGQCSRNNDASLDCGLAQINTKWVPYFLKYGIRQEHLLGDACTNIAASAYILKKNYLLKSNDWFSAIVAYNIGPNARDPNRISIGHKYAKDVVGYWWWFEGYRNGSLSKGRAIKSASNTSPKQELIFEPER